MVNEKIDDVRDWFKAMLGDVINVAVPSAPWACDSPTINALNDIIKDLKSKGLVDNSGLIDYKVPIPGSDNMKTDFEKKEFKLPENISGLTRVSRETDGRLIISSEKEVLVIACNGDRIQITTKAAKPMVNGIQVQNPVVIEVV
jgi:hypothetical protein